MSPIEAFLRDVDASWRVSTAAKIRLDVIGAAALRLQTNLDRGTKDSDILETDQLTDHIKTALLGLAGEHSALHHKHRLYIEVVPQGVPFLPQTPSWHELVSLNETLTHFEVRALDVVDVVVSKLKRFSANDHSDIDEMIQGGLVSHEQLIGRFSDAFDYSLCDARAPDLPGYVDNLNTVERDAFDVEPTPFELPTWADR